MVLTIINTSLIVFILFVLPYAYSDREARVLEKKVKTLEIQVEFLLNKGGVDKW